MTAAMARTMADRDAAGRALADLVLEIPMHQRPESLRTAALEYADLAILEDLAYAAEQDADLCPRCGVPYERHSSMMVGPGGSWACYYDGADPSDDDLEAWAVADGVL